MNIHFLYGTVSGTAEMLCDSLKDGVGDAHDCQISSLDEVEPGEFDADTLYILVSATYGSGQLPDNAQPFLDTLEREKPDLSAVRFAIFGLGDRSFGPTFANGSQTLLTQMLACNAQQIGERAIHDASSDDFPQDIALPWLKDILVKAAA